MGKKLSDLSSFLESKGFQSVELEPTGQIQRFDNHGPKTGWGIAWQLETSKGDPFVYAIVADWKTNERYEYKSSAEFDDDKGLQEKIREAKKQAEKVKQETQSQTATRAEELWSAATAVTSGNRYLTKKSIPTNYQSRLALKVSRSEWGTEDLIVPCKDAKGKLWGIQRISEDGEKFFQPGQKVEGTFHLIGEITPETTKLFICEGVATAASVYLATNCPTASAFNANNLISVAKALREKYPELPIVVAGDDDKFTIINDGEYNTGRTCAEKAAAACQGIAIYPQFKDTVSKPTDFNDLHTLEGLSEVEKQLESSEPPNPKEIIKTQMTGFHDVEVSKNGRVTHKPNFEDLRKYFEKLTQYKLLNGSGICYTWNGKFYEIYGNKYLANFAQKHFSPVATRHMRDEFVDIVLCTNLTPTEWFDETTTSKTNFLNGVLDNKSGSFTPHSPERGFRYCLNYHYDPEATCPNFDKFMKDITCNDSELERILLEYAGYALSSDKCWIHKALVLEGQGSNGKSTFMSVLRSLAGQDNYTAYTLSDLKGEGHRQKLDGKLFNMAEETPSKSLMESSMFKNLVSGGETHARQLYKEPYTFKNRAKLIFACNELPMTSDTSHGYTRRFLIVPFNAKFSFELGNMDMTIEEKLYAERPGIFNRVFKAYKDVVKRGSFTNSEKSNEALDQYRKEIDYTTSWIENNVKTYPIGNGKDEQAVKVSDLYSSYRMDMDRAGCDALQYNTFAKKIARAIPDYDLRIKYKKMEKKSERVLIATDYEASDQF